MSTTNKLHFEVHPSVLFQLGESLITDTVQALIELVKNSYDADATYAKVTINTRGDSEVDGSIFSGSDGWIMIEDDGHGMSRDDITRGWLTISNRQKREIKLARQTTPRGRTPLGDKGLGRLGVQRLGDGVEIFTQRSDGKGYHFGFSWLDFLTAPSLNDVDILLKESNTIKGSGTRLLISDIKEHDTWRGQASLARLQRELSQMISPFKEIRDFNVMVSVDGKTMELAEISELVRDIAPVRYKVKFDGQVLKIEGKLRLDFLKPNTKEGADEFGLCVEADGGKGLAEFLLSKKTAQTIALKKSSSDKWFLEFCWLRRLSDLDQIEYIANSPQTIANPGPFEGEIDAFDLGSNAFREQSYFNKINEYRRQVKEISGIRVYRDGFGIKVDKDWLRFGGQWTSGSSYFGLKPDSTIGYIALSAQANMDLEETTDREGFKDSAYYRNFYLLLSEFKKFTLLAHEFFGREAADYRRQRAANISEIQASSTIESISKDIKLALKSSSNQRKNLTLFRNRISTALANNQKIVPRLRDSADRDSPNTVLGVTEALAEIEPLLIAANTTLTQFDEYLSKMETVEKDAVLLDGRVERLRRQMDDMYEAVALGMVAEALSHEVFNVADQLSSRALTAKNRLKKATVIDKPLLAFAEYVQTSAGALRKQMTFLSPALRYVRDTKQEITFPDVITDLEKFYTERLAKNSISIRIIGEGDKFIIRMNNGKLVQIIDNFIINCEYWLKEEISRGRLASGVITIDCSKPFVRIYDNGKGLDSNIESLIFEPFVSGKNNGRGLGMFIVKQLLDSDGCTVGILPERNTHNRLFKFQIDFRGAIL